MPLKNGLAPKTFEELWANYNPRTEPLETEILHEWEENGIVLQIVRYQIGIFKGQKAMMAAIYGYPNGGTRLPGLVQIHGGGQYADYRAVLTNAKRGYATISIAWAGRINAPDYIVNPDAVKLFWDNKTSDPGFKLTTDWGSLDAYHAPCRNEKNNNFYSLEPASWTLDTIESPRNSSWFLCTLGARRALTFLEQQHEVDPDKLGVYGHSMGGKLTVLTVIDPRVKAAAPSCGGISNNDNKSNLYLKTIADRAYLEKITCPIIFLSPSNDFHGHLEDLPKAVKLIQTDKWRVVSAAHHNHQDNGESEVTGLLWFDQYLKGTFTYPNTPECSLNLKNQNGIPSFSVTPDPSKQILDIAIYYTQEGQINEDISMDSRVNRFWHHARTIKKGESWKADLPLIRTDKPLFAYANVVYALDEPVTGAGYYYGVYTIDRFNLSTLVQVATSEQLKSAGVKATMKPSLVIETFKGDWGKEWFTYKPEFWARKTHKVYDEKWEAPENARLVFEVRSAKSNKMVVGIDNYASEVLLKGGKEWQRVVLSKKDFQNAKEESLPSWSGVMELRLGTLETLKEKIDYENKKMDFGAEWTGDKPEFRNLRWSK